MIYDMKQWKHDRMFSAHPGQEVTADIYKEFLECMPPLTLPRQTALKAMTDYGKPIHSGFLMGEPHDSDRNGLLYMAFGMYEELPGVNRYYYLGLSHANKSINGEFYYFDCLNAFINEGYFPVSDFKDEKEAIEYAINYEAELYKLTIKDNAIVSSKKIYDPFDIFEVTA